PAATRFPRAAPRAHRGRARPSRGGATAPSAARRPHAARGAPGRSESEARRVGRRTNAPPVPTSSRTSTRGAHPSTSRVRGESPPSPDTGQEECAGLLQHLARDHKALDLLCALVDLRDLRVAHEALDRVLFDVAVAAED